MAYREVTLSDIAPFGLATELQRIDCRDVINVLLKNNISPAAICAVLGCITGESHFKRDAVSPRGFKGIFQCKDSYILYANGQTPPYNSGKVQAERWVEKLPGKKGRKSLFMKYGRPGYDYGSTPPSNCKHDLQTPPNCCWIYGCEFEGVSTLTVLQNTNDNNLKYGVDGVLWTYFRCCASEAHSDNRYKAANKFANIINRVCGSNVKKITNFTPAWGNTEPWKGGFVCGQTSSNTNNDTSTQGDEQSTTPVNESFSMTIQGSTPTNTTTVNPFLLAICSRLLDANLEKYNLNIGTIAPQIGQVSVVSEGDNEQQIDLNSSSTVSGNSVQQEVVNISGIISLDTRKGRAKYIFNYFKQRGVPTNTILGLLANMHRTTGGMSYPYNRWQVDHQVKTGKKIAGGGLRGNIKISTDKLIDRYYTKLSISKEDAYALSAKAEMLANNYPGKPNSNESARYMLENLSDSYPIPIDLQLADVYDDIKNTSLMRPIYTPKEASSVFRLGINNKGRKKDDRWDKNGTEILQDLNSK